MLLVAVSREHAEIVGLAKQLWIGHLYQARLINVNSVASEGLVLESLLVQVVEARYATIQDAQQLSLTEAIARALPISNFIVQRAEGMLSDDVAASTL